ncbi:hypothetical protein ACFYNW_07595 [Streptomyces virginiae]|uniref:hypothetical protein n=1 Tax=Streptomyces virginiae TaxID=1961 RepID=UPI0036E4A623
MGAARFHGRRYDPAGREGLGARRERRSGRAEREQRVPVGVQVADRLEIGFAVRLAERVPFRVLRAPVAECFAER